MKQEAGGGQPIESDPRRRVILDAVRRARGSVRAAASALGISRGRLLKQVRELGLGREVQLLRAASGYRGRGRPRGDVPEGRAGDLRRAGLTVREVAEVLGASPATTWRRLAGA